MRRVTDGDMSFLPKVSRQYFATPCAPKQKSAARTKCRLCQYTEGECQAEKNLGKSWSILYQDGTLCSYYKRIKNHGFHVTAFRFLTKYRLLTSFHLTFNPYSLSTQILGIGTPTAFLFIHP